MIRSEERKRAAELKAVDVSGLLRTSLPVVLPHLTAANIDQLQRVLDVAAINAAIENRGTELDQQSIKGKIIHSSQYLRNPAVVAQRDKVLAQKIALKPGENAIRLDLHKLITPDALIPTSDNPDEAAYLLVVADVYLHRGVWLVLDSSAGAMTQQMSSTDLRKWRVRLLLGYVPGAVVEVIATDHGLLTRKGLLSPTRIRAGYAEWVSLGTTMKEMERALSQVKHQIEKGRNEHGWWSDHRNDYPRVSKISDFIGRADWPDESIWEQPHKSYVQALHLVNERKLAEAAEFGLFGAYQAEWCARAVHEYIEATLSGADRAKTILEVAVVLGEVAGSILTVRFVAQNLIRLLTRKSATLALEGGAQSQLSTGGQRQLSAQAKPSSMGEAVKNVRQQAASESDFARRSAGFKNEKSAWIKANPNSDMTKYINKTEELMKKWKVKDSDWMRVVSGPKGTKLGGGVKSGQSTGFRK